MTETDAPVVKPGDTVEGRYRIIKALDSGGMGTVFLAEHVLIKRRVAMKVLRPELAADADVVERFMNEARAAGTLGHPNIVESTDMGFTREGIPYIVFEYLEGTLLVDEIYRLKGIPARRAFRIAHQIASALHAAHTAGIVHRDLKSENIFLTDKDERPDHVKVLDFGISRFLEAEADSGGRNTTMGTPEFMAPEQITSPDKVDRRTDIYALGVILYEMLAARRPFQNTGDAQAVLHAVVHDLPPELPHTDGPPGLSEMIVEKLLAKDPDKRYQSMRELQTAIEAFFDVSRPSGSMTPLSIPVPDTRHLTGDATTTGHSVSVASKRKSRAGLVFLVLAILALGAGGGLTLVGGKAAKPAPAAGSGELAALQSDADQLASMLDDGLRAAALRAQTIAGTPMLRAGIETDAATLKDMAATEHLFAAQPGEVIEVFALRGKDLVSLVRIPDGARGLVPPATGTVRLDAGDAGAVAVAAAPVTDQNGGVGGVLAIADRVDLAAVRRALATHARGAKLIGLAQPLVLDKSEKPGTPATIAVPSKELKAGTLSLQATLSPATPGPEHDPYGPVSYACWGIGGILVVLYV
ncbi:MAG TPA: serine/threonine-protein kinase, partial [Kofleriaceae bacterium]|nr:serine/threonine-protein kinase [Kofleriaceae bacterium]